MNAPLPTEETIAAIATAIAAGQGSIAIVKLSGPQAIKSAQSIVEIPGKQLWESHRVLYGHVLDKEKKYIDEVLVLIMKSPRSFTGEDIVEIHCHGGLIAVQRVFEQILCQKSVRRALPGEFSQRAVLNGRLNLTQAEAINELIAARSKKAAQIAMSGVNGEIQQTIKSIQERLLDQLSEIEARIDFEDDLPPLNELSITNELNQINSELTQLIKDSKKASWFRNGLKIALIGCPNVGKSSLLNRLSRYEKAIVTSIPGTTRDLLESQIILEGIPITLIDTAGIRSTNNAIEQIGINRTQEVLKSADVVCLVYDLSIGWSQNDQMLFKEIPAETPKLLIGNKADIRRKKTAQEVSNHKLFQEIHVTTSAITGAGEDILKKSLLNLCGASVTEGLEVALNERQQDLAKASVSSINKTLEVAKQKLPWDFWTIDLRQAIYTLNELTGNEISEAVLDRIFSRFCIGK